MSAPTQTPVLCSEQGCGMGALTGTSLCLMHTPEQERPVFPGDRGSPTWKPPVGSPEHLVKTGVYQWRAEPITTPEQARVAILRWLEWVDTDPMPEIGHTVPKVRAETVARRRRIYRAIGEHTLEQEPVHIVVTITMREIERRTGIPFSTVRKHLRNGARDARFLKLMSKGKSHPNGGQANIYKLHVDKVSVAA
jgi:hypothetical protein